jgi:hypothetical protein
VLTAHQPSDTLTSSIIICHAVRPDVGTEAAVTKSSDSGLRANNLKEKGRSKIMRRGRLIEKLEEAGIIDHNLSVGAKK